MATVRVSPIINAVMATKRFCGIGSCTWSSRDLLEKNRELMLTRQGNITRGKLTSTDTEKPVAITSHDSHMTDKQLGAGKIPNLNSCDMKFTLKLARTSPLTPSWLKDT